MSQINNNILPEKQRADWTEEEIKKWNRYARWLADKIAYNQFCGVPYFFICRTSCIKGDY